jgi:hypothetical protein
MEFYRGAIEFDLREWVQLYVGENRPKRVYGMEAGQTVHNFRRVGIWV